MRFVMLPINLTGISGTAAASSAAVPSGNAAASNNTQIAEADAKIGFNISLTQTKTGVRFTLLINNTHLNVPKFNLDERYWTISPPATLCYSPSTRMFTVISPGANGDDQFAFIDLHQHQRALRRTLFLRGDVGTTLNYVRDSFTVYPYMPVELEEQARRVDASNARADLSASSQRDVKASGSLDPSMVAADTVRDKVLKRIERSMQTEKIDRFKGVVANRHGVFAWTDTNYYWASPQQETPICRQVVYSRPYAYVPSEPPSKCHEGYLHRIVVEGGLNVACIEKDNELRRFDIYLNEELAEQYTLADASSRPPHIALIAAILPVFRRSFDKLELSCIVTDYVLPNQAPSDLRVETGPQCLPSDSLCVRLEKMHKPGLGDPWNSYQITRSDGTMAGHIGINFHERKTLSELFRGSTK